MGAAASVKLLYFDAMTWFKLVRSDLPHFYILQSEAASTNATFRLSLLTNAAVF